MSAEPVTPPTPEALVAEYGELSAMAGILARVQKLMRTDDTTTSDIAELLRLDAAIAQRLVRVSNSTFFRRGQSCSSLEDALMRIGFAEINQVVSLVAGSTVFARPLNAYGKSALRAWHEAAGCAVAASIIASKLGEDEGIAYTAGLFCTVGRSALSQWMLKNVPKVFLEDAGFPVNYAESEKLVFGFSQSQVAALMLQNLQFPEPLVTAVRQQDESLLESHLCSRLRYVLSCARMLYEGEFGDGKRGTPPCAEAVLNLLGMQGGQLRELVPEFREQIERAIQISYC